MCNLGKKFVPPALDGCPKCKNRPIWSHCHKWPRRQVASLTTGTKGSQFECLANRQFIKLKFLNKHNERKIYLQVLQENTHLLHKGKYHRKAALQFDRNGLCRTRKYALLVCSKATASKSVKLETSRTVKLAPIVNVL